MKKTLVNAYTSLNFGDDLFLKILFDNISANNKLLTIGFNK